MASRASLRERLREGLRTLARQHSSTPRLAAALAVGAYVGTSPFYGLHFLIGAVLGKLLKLNQLAILAGEQIGLPFIAPFHIFVSVQLGHRTLEGGWLTLADARLSVDAARGFWLDWLAGSVLVGAVLGALTGLLGWLLLRAIRREA